MHFTTLENKIVNRSATIAIIGMGYVGLPLAVEVAKQKFLVYGYDNNAEKVNLLKEGYSHIQDISSEELALQLKEQNLIPTTDSTVLNHADIVIICVPTPLTQNQQPDISYIEAAVEDIKKCIILGKLIILESTTYPGTTEDIILKQLVELGYKVGEDFFLGFSPERIDPGNKAFGTMNTPRIVGGVTNKCSILGKLFYETVVKDVQSVSSTRVAEMTKLVENTFRSINISFVNEMAIMCDKLGIDIWEVIDAAKTKPFGYMAFYPGPGIGGHCIPLDPMYLSWKAKGHNFYSRFIELAQDVNKNMPNYVVERLMRALNVKGKPLYNSKILVLGLAYKPNVNDMRESPSLELYELLEKNKAIVSYNDPYIDSFNDSNGELTRSVPLDYEQFSEYDCILLLTAHTIYDYEAIYKYSQLIFDTRNGFHNVIDAHNKIVKLGGGDL